VPPVIKWGDREYEVDSSLEQATEQDAKFGEGPADVYARWAAELGKLGRNGAKAKSNLKRANSPAASSRTKARKSPPVEGSLPVTAYEDSVLEVATLEGIKPKDALPIIGEMMSGKLGPADVVRLRSGDTRWRTNAYTAAYQLKQKGLLDKHEKGLWKLTHNGRVHREAIKHGREPSVKRGTETVPS
jgi:hypothetical protein